MRAKVPIKNKIKRPSELVVKHGATTNPPISLFLHSQLKKLKNNTDISRRFVNDDHSVSLLGKCEETDSSFLRNPEIALVPQLTDM